MKVVRAGVVGMIAKRENLPRFLEVTVKHVLNGKRKVPNGSNKNTDTWRVVQVCK